MKGRYRQFILLLVVLALLLAACGRQEAGFDAIEEAPIPLLTDADLDAAEPELAERVEIVTPIDGGSVPEGIEVELPEPVESAADLSTQGVLPGVSGFLAYVRYNEKSSNPWELWRHNQANDRGKLIYAGTRSIESVAVSLNGNVLAFIIHDFASSSFNVYRYTVSSNMLRNLSNSDLGCLRYDISMSADAKTLVWRQEECNPERDGIIIRRGSNEQSVGGPHAYYPSVSGDGNYIVYNPGGALVLYNRLTKESRTVVTGNSPFYWPSLSNGGTKVAWLEHQYDPIEGHFLRTRVRVKDISSGKTTTAVSTRDFINHPHLTADGNFIAYVLDDGSRTALVTRNLQNGLTAEVRRNSRPNHLSQPYWQKAVR